MSTTKPLDPKTASEVIALAQNSIPTHLICRAIGITEEDIDHWIDQGQTQKNTALARFADEYQKAQALGEIALLTSLRAQAKTDPAAAFKLLDRHPPQPAKTPPRSTPLANQRHEAFAQALATGMNATDAYRKTYGTKAKNPGDIACRLSEKVRQRVTQIQARTEKTTLLTMQKRRELLAERIARGTANDTALVALLTADARFAGELIDKTDLTTDGEALPSVLPTINLQMPATFLNRRQGAGQGN